MDPSDAGNYRCVFAKNGAKQYYFGKAKIAVAKIDKTILPSIICPGKKEALVSERTQALEKRAEKLKKGVAKAEAKKVVRKQAKVAKKSPPKEVVKKSPPKKSPPRVSPRLSPKKGVTISSKEKPRSPPNKGPIGKGGLQKCTPRKGYDFLWFFWEERMTTKLAKAHTAAIIKKYEKEYKVPYPYDDREEQLAETSPASRLNYNTTRIPLISEESSEEESS